MCQRPPRARGLWPGANFSFCQCYEAMVNTLGEALYKYVMIWADDIIVFSRNMEDHIKHVDDVLSRLDKNGFCISREKISVARTEVKWLGYRISTEGVRPDEDKVQKLMQMRKPTSIKELRSALGMWTYFSAFIPGYSIIASPLMKQLGKGNQRLVWDDECEKAWNAVKEKLASAPIMGYPDYTLPIYLHTDACKNGFAAVLTQYQDGKRTLIDAASRTTSPSEKNYSSAKLECACVIWIAKKWKHHLLSAPNVTIVTDSYGLQYLQQKNNRSALVQRWICEMEGFQYTVRYRKGTENISDYLSRQYDTIAAAVQTRGKTMKTRIDYEALSKGERKRKRVSDPKPKKRKRVEEQDSGKNR